MDSCSLLLFICKGQIKITTSNPEPFFRGQGVVPNPGFFSERSDPDHVILRSDLG